MKHINFKALLDYYRQCFELVDVFHFNSNVSKEQYECSLGLNSASKVVIPITHQGITDNRKEKQFDNACLNIGFIGAETPYKGLPVLINVLKLLDSAKWKLNVWGGRIDQDSELPIYYRGKFNKSNINQVYDEMDLLVVPSVWKETFSLVTLEALSYGVPVLVSDNVGAQDLVKEYNPSFVFQNTDELLEKLQSFINDRTWLKKFNSLILEKEWTNNMQNHAKNIIDKFYNN